MSKYDMSEALYAQAKDIVVPRRRSFAIPALVALAGVAMLVANSAMSATADNANLKSAIILFGATFIIVGIILALLRRTGEPYHKEDGCFLNKKELKFYKERSSEIRDLVKRGDFATLRSLREDGVSAVTVVMYTSPRSEFCAAQVFEYYDMEMRPTSDLIVKS